MPNENKLKSVGSSGPRTIPELEQSKSAVLNTLASVHSRRSYKYAPRKVYRLVLRRT
jgi:hypothetical protein